MLSPPHKVLDALLDLLRTGVLWPAVTRAIAFDGRSQGAGRSHDDASLDRLQPLTSSDAPAALHEHP